MKRLFDALFIAVIIGTLYWCTYEIMVFLTQTGRI